MNTTSSEAADIPVKRKNWFSMGIMLSIPAIFLMKMGFFFVLIGMLPTLLTAAFARSRPYVVSTMAALNFAGVFPELLSLMLEGGTPRAIMDKLSTASSWASMYGAASLGIAIVWISPAIALGVLEIAYRSRLHYMETLQKNLEEEWGPGVTGRSRD